MQQIANSPILQKLNEIPISKYKLARHSLFPWCLLLNSEIDPQYNYLDKLFTILNYEFSSFIQSDERLMILEAPPRTGKTDYDINVLLCWLVGNKTKNRFLIAVSNKRLMRQIRNKIERICRSPLFGKVFPEVNIVTCNELYISFSNGNEIELTTTWSQSPIGVGYHWIFFIDFLSGEMLASNTQKVSAFDSLKLILTRKQHDPKTKIIVDNQRLAVDDLSHYFVTSYDMGGQKYRRVTMPFEFMEDYRHPIGNSFISFKKGEFLVKRFDEKERDYIIADVGSFIYETQYLQKPRRPEGDLVKREMFRYYKKEDLEQRQFAKGFMTTDLALKGGKRNDYNVLIFWLVDIDDNLYLIDMVRKKMQGYIAEKILYNFYLKWQDGLKNGGAGCNYVTIESTPNSEMTIQRYKNGFYVDGNKVSLAGNIKELKRIKNKFSRFKQSISHIELGKVYLPSIEMQIDGIDNVRDQILEPFIREYEQFREDESHDNDDIVDCGTDAIIEAMKPRIDLNLGLN